MDGNGRWATARGLPVEAGHREGTRALRRTVEAAIDLGITTLAVYAFSTENWTRPPDEVAALMEILGETIDSELPDLAAAGRAHALLRPARPRPRATCASEWRTSSATTERSRHARPLDRVRLRRPGGAGRGGAHAASRTASRPTRSTRHAIAARLYAPELPEIDLLIRTSGEFRISNFMLWETRLLRVRLHRHALARLRRGRPRSAALAAFAAPRSAVRRPMSAFWSRIVVCAASCCR